MFWMGFLIFGKWGFKKRPVNSGFLLLTRGLYWCIACAHTLRVRACNVRGNIF